MDDEDFFTSLGRGSSSTSNARGRGGGTTTNSFQDRLRRASRHDPDGLPAAGPSSRDADGDVRIRDAGADHVNGLGRGHAAEDGGDDDEELPDFLREDVSETPLQQLVRHWMNERHAPDILPVQEALLSELLDHIRRQSETVQLLRGDPSSSEDEHFRIMLVQTEVERVKFVVRSYLRTRLFKIEKYARHIMTQPEMQEKLLENEVEHARRYANLTDQHFYHAVLQSLPDSQQTLDDAPPFVPPMVAEPDRSRPVFVHAREDCPRITLPDGTPHEMKKGHISLTPYAVVDQLVARGEAELV
ncbi:Sld5-domain-containing protein [Coniophora puteana RWD-64-598 SS2]|uniref:DNA replication complex GINS protein SLD5 n=1 Tax=Coniophora puteana (strain RWD-64-598) TaxID=741705 RepID=A0A5M3MFT1_CONPW|nr:Sld5-domain-containing protein [Coniophora puteana RWD-64-598 SS2]EIW77897.1 Sld5-domain-containing protein [Coniophora puteana RWD-64-598 SS2]